MTGFIAYADYIVHWCQTRGIAIVDVLLCAMPALLLLAFVGARIDQWRMSRGYMGREAGGYPYGNSDDYRWWHDKR